MSIWPGRKAGRGAEAFRQAVASLYRVLGLRAGGSDGALVEILTIDGFEITLDQTSGEDALRMSVAIGLLSEDRLRRQEQMRNLLKRNLAHLRDYRICCALEETDDGKWLVVLQSATPYGDLRPQELADRLGELVSLAEIQQELLAVKPQRFPASAKPGEAAEQNQIIFRP